IHELYNTSLHDALPISSQKERYDKYELELENKLSDMSDLLVDNEQYLEMLSLTELDGFYTPRMQEGSLSDADLNYWKKEVRQKEDRKSTRLNSSHVSIS